MAEDRPSAEPDAGSEASTTSGAGTPVHQLVYEALRARVLYGELPPGSAVTIHGIAADLGAGMTPVREALRRMIAAGALQMQDNRRVTVPHLTPQALDEIEHLRLSVEPELARRAAHRAQPQDLALLKAIDDQLDQDLARGDVPGYLAQNHAFHDRINTLAAAPILSDVADGLWLRFGPAMRVICSTHGSAGLPDLHKDVLSAMALGDAAAAARAMAEDVAQGIALLKSAL